MARKRALFILVGAAIWVAAVATLSGSVLTVQERIARPTESLYCLLPEGASLDVGDAVYIKSDNGLQHVGEVRDVGRQRVHLALEIGTLDGLNAKTKAECWRTPLSVEETIPALFPPNVQRRVGEQLAEEWADKQQTLSDAWGPLVSALARDYLDAVGQDIERSLNRHSDKLWNVAKSHGEWFIKAWPRIQQGLTPAIERHLNPVLSRLMDEAISDAPKFSIAWYIARGRNREAFNVLLDWLGEYLATMSPNDRLQLESALMRTWQEASSNPQLADEFAVLSRRVFEDEALRRVVADIYREAISENPRTVEFLQRAMIENADVKRELYALVDVFAPTARRVLAILLFDSSGRTRPEVVQFVRAAALDRRVSWITLEADALIDEPLASGTVLEAALRGTHR